MNKVEFSNIGNLSEQIKKPELVAVAKGKLVTVQTIVAAIPGDKAITSDLKSVWDVSFDLANEFNCPAQLLIVEFAAKRLRFGDFSKTRSERSIQFDREFINQGKKKRCRARVCLDTLNGVDKAAHGKDKFQVITTSRGENLMRKFGGNPGYLKHHVQTYLQDPITFEDRQIGDVNIMVSPPSEETFISMIEEAIGSVSFTDPVIGTVFIAMVNGLSNRPPYRDK